jgi:hypothetical protein
VKQENETCRTCAGLVRLLSGLDYFPADAFLREQLMEWLHSSAVDHAHASAMIDTWLRTRRDAPKVADLVALGHEVPPPTGELPKGCEICNGEPFVARNVQGGTCADRCSCARGRTLRARDKYMRVARNATQTCGQGRR